MRPIDADALLCDIIERYCKDCDKRKGVKNGKRRIIYEIGDVPCSACGIDDIAGEIEDAPTADVVERKGKNISAIGFMCSACGFGDFGGFHGYEPKFCPNCGAEMEGEKADEDNSQI